jgi:hypothetical protein
MSPATSLQHLIDSPHLERPDDFYQALIEAHLPLTAAQSHAFNARLVLLLANHIGAIDVLREALQAAAAALQSP